MTSVIWVLMLYAAAVTIAYFTTKVLRRRLTTTLSDQTEYTANPLTVGALWNATITVLSILMMYDCFASGLFGSAALFGGVIGITVFFQNEKYKTVPAIHRFSVWFNWLICGLMWSVVFLLTAVLAFVGWFLVAYNSAL
jgi:hypothetical protein